MKNAVALKESSNQVARYDPMMMQTLRNSLYPGAKEESVIMVLSYCYAAKLDVMLKPVHIVPMWIVDKETNKGEMRDVIMPGINLYRIQAARSGCAGISEPEFGATIFECLGGVDINYPEWCKITVKRIIAGKIVEFTAKEYWKENYATAGKDKQTGKVLDAPNAMWKKRPYAQLAKCTEAQALRKAFPEIGAMPTAEEMEGKHLDNEEYEEIQRNKIIPGKGVDGIKSTLNINKKEEKIIDHDEGTGEILEPEEKVEEEVKSCESTLDTIQFLMESATTVKDLMEAMKMAKDLSSADKKQVSAWFNERQTELKS